MIIGEVYGNAKNKLLQSISSSGKSMFIDFKKQHDFGAVKLEALIKYKKINFDCQTWFDVKKNSLMTPNHPNNTNCSWLITANYGSYIILNFKFIEVNSYFIAIFEIKANSITFTNWLIIACKWIWIYWDLWWRKPICRSCKKYHWDSQTNQGVISRQPNICEI